MYRKILSITAAILQLILLQSQFAFGAQKSGTNKRQLATSGMSTNRTPIWSQNVKVPYRCWIPVDKPKQVQMARKKKQMKSKENGKLTSDDTQTLHDKLNRVSTDISSSKQQGRPAR